MIIGVSGKVKSGKNEFFNHFNKIALKNNVKVNEFSFAEKLKTYCADMFGLKYEQLNDRAFKEDIFVNLYDFSYKHRDEVYNEIDTQNIYDLDSYQLFMLKWYGGLKLAIENGTNKNIYIPMRFWLIIFGTDICRKGFSNIWVNTTMNSLNNESSWVCTDVRFKNEFDVIKRSNGIMIRIERDECNNRINEPITEVYFDDKLDIFEYVIYNNGTLEEFHKSIEEFYHKIF